MQKEILLKGITWDHSRGYSPLIAVSQRFSELNSHVRIEWEKRSLQEFADLPIQNLVNDYDLLIIDHPWVGFAADSNCVLPLEQHLPPEFLNDQNLNSLGGSHLSYFYKGHQWALAIDVATPVASYRKDLFKKYNSQIPKSWSELIALAKLGKVAIPSIPIDLLMSFYSFCIACGKEPFLNKEEVIDRETGKQALGMMTDLWGLIDARFFSCNPIQIAEIMTKTDDYWYCPFSYGYSNYSRRGYAKNLLHYTDLIEINPNRVKMRTTLGGTGISISSFSKNKEYAIQFIEYVVSSNIQTTLYIEAGGQPGHRRAWNDSLVNLLTNNFFKNTIPALDRSFIRPRYNGYLEFQDLAGNEIYGYLKNGNSASETLNKLNLIYRKKVNQ
ncbi:extracellular solute-binding protein [Sphingobacterium sp.]|uniref:extracellular solute-binding protein n=1 Tax=Sphingobacterium sp. TaxID=341027 RepID=UPI0028AD8545|nr:extracellular solute-binding protein [Sphingobacterium sp.]